MFTVYSCFRFLSPNIFSSFFCLLWGFSWAIPESVLTLSVSVITFSILSLLYFLLSFLFSIISFPFYLFLSFSSWLSFSSFPLSSFSLYVHCSSLFSLSQSWYYFSFFLLAFEDFHEQSPKKFWLRGHLRQPAFFIIDNHFESIQTRVNVLIILVGRWLMVLLTNKLAFLKPIKMVTITILCNIIVRPGFNHLKNV